MADKKKLLSSMLEFLKDGNDSTYEDLTSDKINPYNIPKTFWFQVSTENEKERLDINERIKELKINGTMSKYYYKHTEKKSNK